MKLIIRSTYVDILSMCCIVTSNLQLQYVHKKFCTILVLQYKFICDNVEYINITRNDKHKHVNYTMYNINR